VPGVLFDGDEKLVFDIYSSGSPLLIGVTKQLTLSFAELVSSSSSLTINGGGVLFPNKTFVDLSANRESAVNRNSWDLGFYTGSDDFRVILNSSSAMMAKQISKNDLAAVTAADTVGFGAEVAFSQFAPTTISLPYIDYPNGDLSRTAIASISANAGDNKVYIVNRGYAPGNPAPARGWKKIRIIRNASGGYTLQHADIAATTFTSVEIAKDEAYFFKYVSFESGAVNVEPQKKKWDFAWTYFSNITNFGAGEVPYLFQDVILLNRNVQVAKVMTATKAFADFGEADIAAQTFLTTQNAIAADWRSGGGPTSSPAVRTDRYYIIKDGDNNYYKVRFTALTQNGERGYPAFESVLVKKG
ncbi:MAG: HmuY family protein, partial [Chitinophagaceae bacterium]|nr:HmuY family protein [Chitinophagaceae bacterium]